MIIMRRLRAGKHKRIYLRSIIMTVLVVALIPVLITSIITFFSNRQIVQEELTSSAAMNLKQTVSSVELVLNNVYDACRQMSFDEMVFDYLLEKDAVLYENMDISNDKTNAKMYYAYYQKKYNIIKKLSGMKNSNRFIASIYLYNYRTRLAVNDMGNSFTKDDLPNPSWVDIARKSKYFPVVIPPDPLNKNAEKRKITMIFANQDANIYQLRFVVAVTIDIETFDGIFQKIDSREDSKYILLNNENKLLYGEISQGKVSKLVAETKKINELNKTYNGVAVIKGTNINTNSELVTFFRSDSFNWKVFNIRNMDTVYKSLSNLRFILFISILISMLTILLMTWITSKTLYNPISTILAIIEGNNANKKLYGNKNEIDTISDSIKEICKINEDLKSRLEESIFIHKEKFMLSLIKRRQISLEELEEKSKHLGINCKMTNIVPIVVASIHSKGFETFDMEEYFLMILDLKDRIIKNISYMEGFEICEDDDGRLLFYINCEYNKFESTCSIFHDFFDVIKKQIRYPLIIAVGNWCENAMSLRTSYERAVSTIRYGMFMGVEGVFRSDSIAVENIIKANIPNSAIDQIYSNIMCGDAKTAITLFISVIKRFAEDRKTDRFNIHLLFTNLLSCFIKATDEMGLDLKDTIGDSMNNESYMDKIIKSSEMDVIEWYKQIIIRISESAGSAINENSRNISDRAIEILEHDIGSNVTLEWVADQLNLSPAYLSKSFKKDKGITFIEYLTKMRINKAKAFLADTDIKIRDISEMLGYSNDHYFIQVFKKYTGITPGDYRNSLKSKNIN